MGKFPADLFPGPPKVLGVVAAAILALASGSASAADSAGTSSSASRGITQLAAALRVDGSFGTQLAVRDVATALEAVRQVQPQSALVGSAATFLTAQTPTDVDSLSRSELAANSVTTTTALLLQQGSDGGFGLTADYQSDPLDTALALRALVAANDHPAAKLALTELLTFASGGAWGPDGGDVAQTSEALLGITAYTQRYGSTSALDAAILSSTTWLAGKQLSDGTWSADGLATRYTAMALSALSPYPTYTSRISSGADALIGAQQSNGSWGDPFTTGLAIRGLKQAGDALDRAKTALLADPGVDSEAVTLTPQTVAPGKSITVDAPITNSGTGGATNVSVAFYLDDPAMKKTAANTDTTMVAIHGEA